MENIPTITSCGVFTLKSASLYAGLLDVIFSSCNIITLWTQIPWSTPIAVIFAFMHLLYIYGCHGHKPSFMAASLILNFGSILMIGCFILLLPFAAVIMLIELKWMYFAATLITIITSVKILVIDSYLFIVKYSQYKVMIDNPYVSLESDIM